VRHQLMREFDLINRFFRRPSPYASGVDVGIGDDGAVLSASPGMDTIVVTDTSVEGVHFRSDQSPHAIGYRALAVNLSDIAAMGALPRWATLNLTLPHADPEWLSAFADGFFELADQWAVTLVGGDTTRGPLTMTVTVGGEVARGASLLRSGARVGDMILVSGPLGGAAAALECSNQTNLERVLQYPTPRLMLGQSLLGVATSAIDISDGFLADLQHILDQSGNLGANIDASNLPLFDAAVQSLGREKALDLALRGGDDYELCFTVPPEKLPLMKQLKSDVDSSPICVGKVVSKGGCRVHGIGDRYARSGQGYQHEW
jgi:thiamine-monophosphate kinase